MKNPTTIDTARVQIALASQKLAREGVLDAFGHISMRHPEDPGCYLMSRYRLSSLITVNDILEFSLDSRPLRARATQLDPERVIDGCIYQARADVMAVCHHHAPAVLPFCIAGVSIPPEPLPFWNQHDQFGDTALRVTTHEEARSLTDSLGHNTAVLMRHHGATVVGRDLYDVVRRSVSMCKSAEAYMRDLVASHTTTIGLPSDMIVGRF